MFAQGSSIEEVARRAAITESTWHRWRTQHGGINAEV